MNGVDDWQLSSCLSTDDAAADDDEDADGWNDVVTVDDDLYDDDACSCASSSATRARSINPSSSAAFALPWTATILLRADASFPSSCTTRGELAADEDAVLQSSMASIEHVAGGTAAPCDTVGAPGSGRRAAPGRFFLLRGRRSGRDRDEWRIALLMASSHEELRE